MTMAPIPPVSPRQKSTPENACCACTPHLLLINAPPHQEVSDVVSGAFQQPQMANRLNIR